MKKKRRRVQDFDVPSSTVIAQRAAAPLRFVSVKSTHKGLQTPRMNFIGGVREEIVAKAIRNVFTNLMYVQINLCEVSHCDVNRLSIYGSISIQC